MNLNIFSKVRHSPLPNLSFCQLSNSFARRTPYTRTFRTTSSRMVVHDIEDEAKFEETIKNNRLVIVDAYATWCGPCRAVAPIIELLSTKHPHAHFVRFDVDKVPELSKSLGILALPTFVFFKDAEKIKVLVGANSVEVERLVAEMA